MCTSRTIPLNNKKTLFGRLSSLNWEIHDKMSKIKPKAIELIAFRKGKILLTPTTDDEEMIMFISKNWGHMVYCRDDVIHNKGP